VSPLKRRRVEFSHQLVRMNEKLLEEVLNEIKVRKALYYVIKDI
jgi:hypothetical protein